MRKMREIVAGFSPERRKKIARRAKQLIAEEMTLRELRQAHQRTQASIAKELHITQDGVSRLEQRSDALISTLRQYVNAMGGELKVIAEFPAASVSISGFGDLAAAREPGRSRESKSRRPSRSTRASR